MSSSYLLRISRLKKYFDLGHGRMLHAVDDVSLDVAQGSVTCLVGESGSGKSTLGKMVMGLLDKTDGTIWYKDTKLPDRYGTHDFRQYRQQIQMIFQDPYTSLNSRLTVREIIAEPLRLMDPVNRNASREATRIDEWLNRVGMSREFNGRYPHELSGGQRQRVGIARALIMEPSLVVCDEPISALDVSVQAQIVNLLMDLRESMGLTLIFIAHNLAIVRHMADRIAVMYLGSIVEEGASQVVFDRPLHPYSQALMDANPRPDPHHERRRSRVPITGETVSPINPHPGCMFAGRCPVVMRRCWTEKPLLRQTDSDRRAACHRLT